MISYGTQVALKSSPTHFYINEFGVTKYEAHILVSLYCAWKHNIEFLAKVSIIDIFGDRLVYYGKVNSAVSRLEERGFIKQVMHKPDDKKRRRKNIQCLTILPNGKKKVEEWLR